MANYVLGKGTYGLVQSINGYAVKQFKRTSHLLQEYAAGLYLNSCPYTVNVTGANFKDKTMTMIQYKGSLKDWLRYKRSTCQKMYMLKQILLGLTWLNDLGLVHGDLKPGNIVANWNSNGDLTDVAIADLGFVAPESYSKAERTAPIYREKEVERDFRHDIFSLGVICLECFGHTKISHQSEHEYLISQAKKNISDSIMNDLVVRMLSQDRKNRPTARYLLHVLFKESPPFQTLASVPKYSHRISVESEIDLEKIFRLTEKGYKMYNPNGKEIIISVKRSKLGYNACKYYLGRKEIKEAKHKTYAAATLAILSSIFGESGFTPEEASRYARVEVSIMYSVIFELLNHSKFLSHLYFTSKGCRSFSSSSSSSDKGSRTSFN